MTETERQQCLRRRLELIKTYRASRQTIVGTYGIKWIRDCGGDGGMAI
jgi:hypothetical protein